jgi:hypothetical protein
MVSDEDFDKILNRMNSEGFYLFCTTSAIATKLFDLHKLPVQYLIIET